MGILRITLLFGSAIVALALFATSYLADRTPDQWSRAGQGGIDFMSTGSVSRGSAYTLRRSVLQTSPSAVCVLRADGSQSGDC